MYGGERSAWEQHFERETGEWFAACPGGRRERTVVLGAGRLFWADWLRRRAGSNVRGRETIPRNWERETTPYLGNLGIRLSDDGCGAGRQELRGRHLGQPARLLCDAQR